MTVFKTEHRKLRSQKLKKPCDYLNTVTVIKSTRMQLIGIAVRTEVTQTFWTQNFKRRDIGLYNNNETIIIN
jgi:hypothetical protein